MATMSERTSYSARQGAEIWKEVFSFNLTCPVTLLRLAKTKINNKKQ
jgi:hypothetical protein